MANEVFANDREVSCKAADGKSIAAAPDVCWTPPGPPAGPLPIPWVNSSFAKDTTKASKTVKISGKPIMLRDKSNFKTSTGNEGATQAFGKGLLTGVIKGKSYYTSWSPNVFVEGKNVCRHMDTMTHNHGSVPGNTAPWLYSDKNAVEEVCKKTRDKIQDKCTPSEAEQKRNFMRQDARNKRRKDAGKRARSLKALSWKDKHCHVVPFKLNVDKSIENGIKETQQKVKEFEDSLKDFGLDELTEGGKAALKSFGVRTGVKHTVALVGGPITEGIAAVTTVVDGLSTAYDGVATGYTFYKQLDELEGKIKSGKDTLESVQKALGKKSLSEMTPEEKKEALQKVRADLTEAFSEAAKQEDCLKARSCMFVPFKEAEQKDNWTEKKPKWGRKPKEGFEHKGKIIKPANSKGCCPGQTPHHIIPDAYFLDENGKKRCPGYEYDKAPTVCAVGGNHQGSHGKMHTRTDTNVGALSSDGEVSYTDARDEVMKAHAQTFGDHCSQACLKAQLDHYHGEMAKCEPLETKKLTFKITGSPDEADNPVTATTIKM